MNKNIQVVKRIMINDGINLEASENKWADGRDYIELTFSAPRTMTSDDNYYNDLFDNYVHITNQDHVMKMPKGDTTISQPVSVSFHEMTVKDAANLVEVLLSLESVRDAVDDSIPTTTLKLTAKELELLQKVEFLSRNFVREVLTKDELKVWESLSDLINLKGGE